MTHQIEQVKVLQEMIEMQKRKLLACAQRIVPTVIGDDLMQPQDFIELEMHPEFRYEEGLLAGLESALQALLQK